MSVGICCGRCAGALLMAGGLLAGGCRLWGSGDGAGDTAPGSRTSADRVWVGPMPFTRRDPRELRPDYVDTLTDRSAWPDVLAKTDVFKSYIMVLPSVPLPGRSESELPDRDLRRLVAFTEQQGLRVAFEVGGLRRAPGETPRPGTWGQRMAEGEYRHLKRWLDAGGRIDYLTSDHAVMHNLGHHTYRGTDCGLSMLQVLDELAVYFREMQKRIPGVRVGVIESLGYFHVRGADGTEYPRTVKKLPVWDFETFFVQLCDAFRRHGVALDHFHIDFGYMGVDADRRIMGSGSLNVGRVLAAERLVASAGVRSGVIVNAFHDRRAEVSSATEASREAAERTLAFFRGYAAAGGSSDHLVIQTWQPYPDRTGPEGDPLTVLGLARELLESPAFRTRSE